MPFLRRGFLRSANRRNELYCRIDPSPIAAIFVIFLELFISQVRPHGQRSVSVDMVPTLHARDFPAADRDDAIIIAVTRDGTVYLGNTKIVVSELQDQIRDATADGAYGTIFLRADARTKYGDVGAMVARISASGVQHVVLLVESTRPPAR